MPCMLQVTESGLDFLLLRVGKTDGVEDAYAEGSNYVAGGPGELPRAAKIAKVRLERRACPNGPQIFKTLNIGVLWPLCRVAFEGPFAQCAHGTCQVMVNAVTDAFRCGVASGCVLLKCFA
jgi:hypothetical protein